MFSSETLEYLLWVLDTLAGMPNNLPPAAARQHNEVREQVQAAIGAQQEQA